MTENSMDMSQSETSAKPPLPTQGVSPTIVDLVDCIDTFRKTVLQEATALVSTPEAEHPEHRAESFSRMAAMLASSLEELRVAEEELADQSAIFQARQLDYQWHVRYERRLFDCAPTALMATDLMGTITEANRAATALLGKESEFLDRKPLISLVSVDDRSAFRDRLRGMSIADGASDWRFRILRQRELRLAVSATVQMVGRGNRSGGPALLWSLPVV